jgi:hypothetical protein
VTNASLYSSRFRELVVFDVLFSTISAVLGVLELLESHCIVYANMSIDPIQTLSIVKS